MDVRSDSDLGSYTCTGENSVGTTTEEVAVTGEPLPAVVTSPATSHLPHSYSLHWTAASLQPLTETRLLLREVAHNYFYILNSHVKPIKAFKSRSFATMWHFGLVFSPLRTLQCRWGRGTGPT